MSSLASPNVSFFYYSGTGATAYPKWVGWRDGGLTNNMIINLDANFSGAFVRRVETSAGVFVFEAFTVTCAAVGDGWVKISFDGSAAAGTVGPGEMYCNFSQAQSLNFATPDFTAAVSSLGYAPGGGGGVVYAPIVVAGGDWSGMLHVTGPPTTQPASTGVVTQPPEPIATDDRAKFGAPIASQLDGLATAANADPGTPAYVFPIGTPGGAGSLPEVGTVAGNWSFTGEVDPSSFSQIGTWTDYNTAAHAGRLLIRSASLLLVFWWSAKQVLHIIEHWG